MTKNNERGQPAGIKLRTHEKNHGRSNGLVIVCMSGKCVMLVSDGGSLICDTININNSGNNEALLGDNFRNLFIPSFQAPKKPFCRQGTQITVNWFISRSLSHHIYIYIFTAPNHTLYGTRHQNQTGKKEQSLGRIRKILTISTLLADLYFIGLIRRLWATIFCRSSQFSEHIAYLFIHLCSLCDR